MHEQEKAFWEAIQVFDELGILKHVMIIGSWAEYLYPKVLGEKFEPNIKTRDVDLFYWDIHDPKEKVEKFVARMQEHGFLYDEDYYTGVGKFYKEDLLELELLTHVKGSQEERPYKIDSLNIKVDSLRVLNILADYPRIITANGYEICIPEPAAFVFQKILALPKRVPEYKKEKDIEAIKEVLICIKENQEQSLLLKEIYDELKSHKKSSKTVTEVIKTYGIDIDSIMRGY